MVCTLFASPHVTQGYAHPGTVGNPAHSSLVSGNIIPQTILKIKPLYRIFDGKNCFGSNFVKNDGIIAHGKLKNVYTDGNTILICIDRGFAFVPIVNGKRHDVPMYRNRYKPFKDFCCCLSSPGGLCDGTNKCAVPPPYGERTAHRIRFCFKDLKAAMRYALRLPRCCPE